MVHKQKNRTYLTMWFFYVCIRRETKEGNTEFELQACTNYVSGYNRIQLNALKKTEVVRETSRSLNRFSAL